MTLSHFLTSAHFIESKQPLNEGIHRSEESRSVKKADDGSGEDVRGLFSSSSDVVKMAMMKVTKVMMIMTVVLMMTVMEATMVLMKRLIVLKIICSGWVLHQANIIV